MIVLSELWGPARCDHHEKRKNSIKLKVFEVKAEKTFSNILGAKNKQEGHKIQSNF
jgi:hypothetical protein